MEHTDLPSGFDQGLQQPDLAELENILQDKAACIARIAPLTKFLPLATMTQRRAIPVLYQEEERRLTVITDQDDIEEIRRILTDRSRGVPPEIYRVPEATVNNVLDWLSAAAYAPLTEAAASPSEPPPQPEVSIDYQPAETDTTEGDGDEPLPQLQAAPDLAPPRHRILLIVPGSEITPHLAFAWKAEGLFPELVASVEEAREKLALDTYDSICVHAELAPDLDQLAQDILLRSPGTALCTFASERHLLMGNVRRPLDTYLSDSHLRLARYRHLASRDRIPSHQGDVADLAVTVAEACDIPDNLRTVLSSAAYLHDLAADDVARLEAYERADIIRLSAGLLAKWQYPKALTDILRWAADGPPMESEQVDWTLTTSACILRAVDDLCHLCPDYRAASTGDLRRVRQELISRTEVYTCPAVVDQLMKVVTGRSTGSISEDAAFRVHVLCIGGQQCSALHRGLTENGYVVEQTGSIAECAREYRRLRPKVLVVICSGSTQALSDHLLELALKGVRIDQTPTLVLVDHTQIGTASWCIRHGVEDILPVNTLPEAVVAKIDRIKGRLRKDIEHRQAVISSLGTHGSLEDMTLTNLLEATRCGNRPMQISITGDGRAFTIYVQGDKILFAESDTVSGLPAVVETLGLTGGVWSVDPVEPENIPEPNVDATIGSVLLEACYQHDKSEHRRSSQDISELVT